MLIYKVTNTVNGKVYIGKTMRKTVNRRWNEHLSRAVKGSEFYLYRAIRKYGVSAFKIEVIDNASTSEELSEKEKQYVSVYESNTPDKGYNLTSGGDGTFGYKRPPGTNRSDATEANGSHPFCRSKNKGIELSKGIVGFSTGL